MLGNFLTPRGPGVGGKPETPAVFLESWDFAARRARPECVGRVLGASPGLWPPAVPICPCRCRSGPGCWASWGGGPGDLGLAPAHLLAPSSPQCPDSPRRGRGRRQRRAHSQPGRSSGDGRAREGWYVLVTALRLFRQPSEISRSLRPYYLSLCGFLHPLDPPPPPPPSWASCPSRWNRLYWLQ